MLKKWLKISHHKHTARLRGHEHTSYAPLMLVLAVTGVILMVFSATVTAQSPGPESGSIGLSGAVPGKPPTIPATITSPTNGQRFSSSPVPVEGTCPPNTLVEVYKNDIFAGSVFCTDNGTFSIDVDLLIGENVLTARVSNSLGEEGPESNKVRVFFDLLGVDAGPLSSLNFGASQQLIINTDAVFRGVFPGKEFSMPIGIIGGTPPYAVDIRWGDSENKMVPRNSNETFRVTHTYKKPGTYQISLQATDSQDRVAFLNVAAVVNGPPEEIVSAAAPLDRGILRQLLLLWPLYTAAAAAVISFWLGEVREKRVLKNHGLLVHT